MLNVQYSDQIMGTQDAGYVAARQGPFRCSTCQHYHGYEATGTCDHPVVKLDAHAGRIKTDEHNRPVVEEAACCSYWRK